MSTSSVLSTAQRARIERNRLAALERQRQHRQHRLRVAQREGQQSQHGQHLQTIKLNRKRTRGQMECAERSSVSTMQINHKNDVRSSSPKRKRAKISPPNHNSNPNHRLHRKPPFPSQSGSDSQLQFDANYMGPIHHHEGSENGDGVQYQHSVTNSNGLRMSTFSTSNNCNHHNSKSNSNSNFNGNGNGYHHRPSSMTNLKSQKVIPPDLSQSQSHSHLNRHKVSKYYDPYSNSNSDYEIKELSPSQSQSPTAKPFGKLMLDSVQTTNSLKPPKPSNSKSRSRAGSKEKEKKKRKKKGKKSCVNNLITNYLHNQSSMNYDKILGTNNVEDRKKKKRRSKKSKSKRGQKSNKSKRTNSSSNSKSSTFTPSYISSWRPPSIPNVFNRLSHSKFRSKFKLYAKEIDIVRSKKHDLEQHAFDFVNTRLAAAYPKNDGKQTPMRGHPVFIAQHATATCCRSCLSKWHYIPIGQTLSSEQRIYMVEVILRWITLNGPKS